MKVLLIGNGGREHAMAKKLKENDAVELYNAATGVNPGIQLIANEVKVLDIMNKDEVLAFAERISPDFTIIGPDDPIGEGLADVLIENNIPTFAPTKKLAELESSKGFTREVVRKILPSVQPGYKICKNIEDVKDFFANYDGKVVIKADGLMGGKGVLVAGDHFSDFSDIEDFAEGSISKFGQVVMEEKLIGVEFSLISITDGESFIHCPAISDHKRAYDDDQGPNTGGMGTISGEFGSLPFLNDLDVEEAKYINEKTIQEAQKVTGETYRGVLFGGFMKTKDGIKLIEYNCRFGDPECLNLMSLLQSDFADIAHKAAKGELKNAEARWSDLASVCVYLCPEGYPTKSVKNKEITLKKGKFEEVDLYFSSVIRNEDAKLMLKGSRAIGIVGKGKDIPSARKKVMAELEFFDGPLFYRTDIGSEESLAKREKIIRNFS